MKNFGYTSTPDEPIGTSDYEGAANAGNQCRGKGIVVSIVEILQSRVGRSLLPIRIFMASSRGHPLTPQTFYRGSPDAQVQRAIGRR